jgi:hypothetical protein
VKKIIPDLHRKVRKYIEKLGFL